MFRVRRDAAAPAAPSPPAAGASLAPAAGAPSSAPSPPPSTSQRPETSARREHSLLSLLELSNELSASLDLFEIADLGLFHLMGHFGSARGALWLFPDDQSGDAVLVRSHGIAEPVARAVGSLWTRWLADRLGAVHEPVLLSELGEVATGPGLGLAHDSDIALFAPVLARGRFLGLLALGRRVGGEKYGVLDLEILQASVNLLGGAVENNLLVNRMFENNRQLRLANEKLEGIDRLKSEFLRNLNHELKTPLTIMIAYLDSLLSQETEDGPRRAHLRQVHEQTAKLQGMMMNLLDFSKLVRSELDVRPEPTDVVHVVRTFHEERRPGVARGLRELRFTAAAAVPPALCDPERLVQVLDALVDNATKFTPQGARIRLRAESATVHDREWVRVQVADDGPGIPPELLSVIFEEFRQGDGSATRARGGMGLGLPLARRVVREMGGALDVESKMGSGATFTILLPV